jgi:ABC-type sugar transport system substrate-binding protein
MMHRMLAVALTVYWLGTTTAAAAAAAADSSTADAGVPGAFFFESFGPGWQDRWQYSSAKKYEGRFATVQPQGYQDTAIQVRYCSSAGRT